MHVPRDAIQYPESDGKPMSDNTLQFEWIQLLSGNLAALFRDRGDVFVGGNLLWYPVEGFPKIRQAPDTFVVFGRPKGYRGSYLQWEEDEVPMTVVFEVRSPNDSDRMMRQKRNFYDRYGVEEYYLVDPQENTLQVYRRPTADDLLGPVRLVDGVVTSPRLGIRFEVGTASIAVFHPDGRPFLPVEAIEAERAREHQRADEAQRRADEAERRAVRVGELARRVQDGSASAEEVAEFARLVNELTGVSVL
jgi:Uma2 family endonuclease